MAEKKSSFVNEVRNMVNQTGRRPANTIVKNPQVAAVVSKLVQARERPVSSLKTNEAGDGMIHAGVDQISKSVMGRIEDNENIFQLFPDVERCFQILIASIMSPKDMVEQTLIFRSNSKDLPPALISALNQEVEKDLVDYYRLKEDCPKILRNILAISGSHVKLVLPESAVDFLVNSRGKIAAESIYTSDIFKDNNGNLQPMGILGNPHLTSSSSTQSRLKMVMESLHRGTEIQYDQRLYVRTDAKIPGDEALAKKLGDLVEVTDNFNILKLPRLLNSALEQQNKDFVHQNNVASVKKILASESYHLFTTKATTETPDASKISSQQLVNMIYKSSSHEYRPLSVVPSPLNLQRHSIGRGLEMDIPSEAAIPVHVPGKVSEHVGYFIPIDIDGNPVSITSRTYDGNNQGLMTSLMNDKSTNSLSSLLIEKARRNLGSNANTPTLDYLADLYAEIIETDLMERLRRGRIPRGVEISRNNEIYRVMLARAMKSQFTRLVYVPAEYITYFAFQYHRNGIGKSYLDDLANLTSLRAMNLFSTVMAKIKNSINLTEVKIIIDERDNDPEDTVEKARNFIARMRQQYFPAGLNRIVDITDWLQRAGLMFTIEGHPGLPTTRFEWENKTMQHAIPDDDLDERLRHQTYMHMGLSPEIVDASSQANFATTVQHDSILFSKIVTTLSNDFSVKLTDYGRKIASHDENLRTRLRAIFKKHQGEIEEQLTDDEKKLYDQVSDKEVYLNELMNSYIESLEIDLPKPQTTTLTNLLEDLERYEQAIDKALDYCISDKILPAEFAGESSNYVNTLRESWKAALVRQWMADNNFLPEVFEICKPVTEGREIDNLLESLSGHAKVAMVNVLTMLKKMQAAKDASDNDLKKLNPGEPTDFGSGTSDSPDEGGGGDAGDDLNFGDDLFGGGDDETNTNADEPGPEPGDEESSGNNPTSDDDVSPTDPTVT